MRACLCTGVIDTKDTMEKRKSDKCDNMKQNDIIMIMKEMQNEWKMNTEKGNRIFLPFALSSSKVFF